MNHPDSRERRIDAAAEAANDAFFAVVAEHFPEITTGDFAPDASAEFAVACGLAVRRWVASNEVTA